MPVPRTRSSHHIAADTVANFGFKSGTRIIAFLVSFSIPKFAQKSRQMLENFGIGTLERIPFLWNRNALSLHSLAHILIAEPASISPEYALRCGSISPPETGSPHVARNRPPQSARPSADRPRGPAPD